MCLRKPYFVYVLFLLFGFAACVPMKDISSSLEEALTPEYVDYSNTKQDFIQVNTNLLDNTDSLIKVTKVKKYFVPALILWAWNQTLNCEINNSYFTNIFTKTLIEKAELYHLQSFMEDKRIEIDIVKVPSQFLYINQGSVLFGGFFYSYNYNNEISTNNQEFKFVFRLIKDDKVLMRETYQYPFQTKIQVQDLAYYDFVFEYMQSLTEDFEFASSDLVQHLIDDL